MTTRIDRKAIAGHVTHSFSTLLVCGTTAALSAAALATSLSSDRPIEGWIGFLAAMTVFTAVAAAKSVRRVGPALFKLAVLGNPRLADRIQDCGDLRTARELKRRVLVEGANEWRRLRGGR